MERALELNEKRNQQLDQVAYGSLGNSLYNLGQKEKAFEQFELALKLNPNDEQVLNNYAYFLSLEKMELEKDQLIVFSYYANVLKDKIILSSSEDTSLLSCGNHDGNKIISDCFDEISVLWIVYFVS